MGRKRIDFILQGEQETKECATEFVKTLAPNTFLALHGDLGAGKTTFVKGLVIGLGGQEEMVSSPTFTYLHHYPVIPSLFHFDIYRFQRAEDFLAMGFEEYFHQDGIVVLEWAERIASLSLKPTFSLYFSHLPEGRRSLRIEEG